MRIIANAGLLAALLVAGGCPTDADEIPGPPEFEDDDVGDDDALADDDVGDDDLADDDSSDDDSSDDDSGDDDSSDDDVAGPPPGHCWTVAPTGGQLAVIDVDIPGGTWSEVGRWGQWVEFAFHTDGIALLDGSIHACGYDGNGFSWFELDMVAGTSAYGPSCDSDSIGATSSQLVVLRSMSQFELYDSYADLLAGNAAAVYQPDIHASRVTATDTHFYAAWHSTEEIDVYDAATGAYSHTIPLQDWDTWVWGMSVVGDSLYVMNHEHFAQYDVHTGALLADTVFGDINGDYMHPPSGLWCN